MAGDARAGQGLALGLRELQEAQRVEEEVALVLAELRRADAHAH
jgi:hypothetical protein